MTMHPRLTELGAQVSDLLRARSETVAVAEGSAGGLISAALLAVPGASAYYQGGAVVYTRASVRAFVSGAVPTPPDLRGATEQFAVYLAESIAVRLETSWGIGEAGAAGPANPYGDPAGHCWVAVSRAADESVVTRHVLTGVDARDENMALFAIAALELFVATLTAVAAAP